MRIAANQAWKLRALAALAVAAAAGLARAEDAQIITEPGFISGTMNIDFGTRKNLDSTGSYVEGSPAKGSQDLYDFSLSVAKTTEYSGKIMRKPRLVTKVLGREEQPAELVYDIQLAVRNPQKLEEKKNVGKWVGTVTIGADGVYDLGGSTGSPLRMAVDAIGKAQAFTSNFGGRIIGKAAEKKGKVQESLQQINEYTRMINGKKVKITVKHTDPLKFNGVVLAQGPAQVYPKTTVNGNLDYDYETGNWYTNGIHFKYSLNGVDYEDIVTGTIKWVEDPSRKSNGKGQYEFNLRFNEEKNQPATSEKDAFASDGNTDEAAFFAVDNTIPCMNGTVTYVDTMSGGGDEPTVTASKIVYSLNANKLTKQQAVNFFKLWMIVVGPTNDE